MIYFYSPVDSCCTNLLTDQHTAKPPLPIPHVYLHSASVTFNPICQLPLSKKEIPHSFISKSLCFNSDHPSKSIDSAIAAVGDIHKFPAHIHIYIYIVYVCFPTYSVSKKYEFM